MESRAYIRWYRGKRTRKHNWVPVMKLNPDPSPFELLRLQYTDFGRITELMALERKEMIRLVGQFGDHPTWKGRYDFLDPFVDNSVIHVGLDLRDLGSHVVARLRAQRRKPTAQTEETLIAVRNPNVPTAALLERLHVPALEPSFLRSVLLRTQCAEPGTTVLSCRDNPFADDSASTARLRDQLFVHERTLIRAINRWLIIRELRRGAVGYRQSAA